MLRPPQSCIFFLLLKYDIYAKSAQIMNIQLDKFSQRKHIDVSSTRVKKENITRTPRNFHFPSQSLSTHKVIALLTSNP